MSEVTELLSDDELTENAKVIMDGWEQEKRESNIKAVRSFVKHLEDDLDGMPYSLAIETALGQMDRGEWTPEGK